MSTPRRSASMLIGKNHDKSFRVSKLATQIKDSVITSFGASRAMALSVGLNRIAKNLDMVKCRAFYQWFHLSGRGGQGGVAASPARHRPSVAAPATQSHSERLATVVFRNFMYRSFGKRVREALCRWMKAVGMTPPPNLLPTGELREEHRRLRRKSQLLDPGENKTLGMVRRRLASMFSSTLRVSVRRSFDRWKSLARILSYKVEMQRQNMKVEIGMQHIRSEKEKINDIRTENAKLQSWLLCSIFFMKWKMEDMSQKLLDERDIRFKEREMVHKRVESLKQRLVRAQQVERDAVATAALRGQEFCERMKLLQGDFELAVAPTKLHYFNSMDGDAQLKRSAGGMK